MSKTYFIVNLRAKCEKIVDFIFLDGYNTPQLLLLFEKTATWGGRTPVRNKTISLLSITLNVVRKRYNIPFILYDILSYDFHKLYPIPYTGSIFHSAQHLQRLNDKSNRNRNTNIGFGGGYSDRYFGGAFLIGSNSILHFGQTIDYGLSFNQHGDVMSKDYPLLRKWTERVINLENCTLATLHHKNENKTNKNNNISKEEQSKDFILSDGDGFMYLLSIQSGKMNLCTFGMGPIASTMTSIKNDANNFVFIGSRLANSLLICHQIKQIKQKTISPPKQIEKKAQISEPSEYDKLFGDNNDNNDNANNKNPRKRTFSQMNDKMEVDSSANNGVEVATPAQADLAMDLFGITTETLAAAAENPTDPKSKSASPSKEASMSLSNSKSATPVPASRHISLYGPKVKRRKLTSKTELQTRDLDFINVTDFHDEKLFELEIEKEKASRPNTNFDEDNAGNEQNNEQENEMQIKEHARNEQILREKYEFKMHDMITNLSPITSVVMSKSHDTRYLHSDYINLMATTGFGTQAKLSIVQEGVRPQILAKTNSNKIITNVVGCWTLYKSDDAEDKESKESKDDKKDQKQTKEKSHNYLVVTNLQYTQVLDVKDKIKVIIESDFKNDCRTINCDHIIGDDNELYTVQIYSNGVRLLKNMNLIYEYNAVDDDNNNAFIIDAFICDPYILLHLSDKKIRLLTFDKKLKQFKVNTPNLPRYKEINDKEKERRKKEFVSRRCNRMTWDQYSQLESCINEFRSVFGMVENNNDLDHDMEQNEKNLKALMDYIDETLINPSIPDLEENKDEKQEKEEAKSNSTKQEMSDSDDEEGIQLADDLKKKVSTGWQDTDWTKPKTKKTLFNLNLSIDIILRRLYGKQLTESFSKSPSDILQEMITKDLDCGEIEKIFLFEFGGIKIKTLKQLNGDWKLMKKYLSDNTPNSYQQLLRESYQQQRRDIMKRLSSKKNIYNRRNSGDTKEKLMRDIYFGDSSAVNNKAVSDDDDDEDIKMSDKQGKKIKKDTFAVIARASGTLQIFKIPNFKLVFECSEIQIGHDLLPNNLIHDESLSIILSKHQLTKRKSLKDFINEEIDGKVKNNEKYFEDELIPISLKDELWCSSTNVYNDIDDEEEFEIRKVREIYVNTFDNNPYLLVFLSNGDLLIYQIFEFFKGGTSLLSKVGRNLSDIKIQDMEILPIRLKRFAHKLFTRDKFLAIHNNQINKIKKKIYPIDNINGLRGTLITGNHPAVILSHRGAPIIHDFSVNDDIRGFSILNHPKITTIAQNDKIKNGCVYFNQYGLTIATIPKSILNITFDPNAFKDIDEEEKKDDEKKKDKQDEENGDKEPTDKPQTIPKKSNGKEEKDDDKQDENKDKDEDIDDEENDPAMEIFGHSFVLEKQKIVSNLYEYIDIDYNFEYPVAHIPLSETLHFIIEHENSGTYLFIMSRYKYIAGTEMLKSRDIRPIETYFECRLLNPYKWRFDDRLTGFTIQQTTEEKSIPVSEHILCGKSVIIQESSRIGSQTVVNKNMIILGTGTNQGEDSASIGRIVMLEIIADKESKKLDAIQAPSKKNQRDERFYTQTRNNSNILLSSDIHEPSLEDDNMFDIYYNATNTEKQYYNSELSYYKKCMEQDKVNNIKYRIHYVFARRERAAVTALNCVNGLIIAAIGPKLLLFRWDGTQLIGCAFLDTRIHCHSILVLKNFIVTADIFQGLDLFHWEQDIATIIKLARDIQYRSVYSTHLMINNNNPIENKLEFQILVSDMHQNMHIISYQPHLQYGFLNKFDKEKLYTKCLFHIGTDISDSISMRFRSKTNTLNKNYFNLNATTNGSISYLIPISEQIYRRLSSLHSQMLFYCRHHCGLNPREYRYSMNNCISAKDVIRSSHIMHNHSGLNAIHGMDRSPTLTSKNIIDHDLIEQFLSLDYRTQNKLIINIGVASSNIIFNHLSQLTNNTKWF